MAAHSGHSNAYTAATETNYFFEVAATAESHTSPSSSTPPSQPPTPAEPLADGLSRATAAGSEAVGASASTNDLTPTLYGALDRFSQFFIAPLFLSSSVDRELRAVDSENKKNLQSDPWRLLQLSKSLSNPKHPFHHFSTGNLQTLRDDPQKRGVNVRDEFMKFHEEHYSANRMKLVVVGRESLDVLESWVTELFSAVKNKDLPQNRWDDVQPFTPEYMSRMIYAKPVMDTRTLDIMFNYQDEELMYESQPSRYISHLIGHEGPGSILAYIKAKGWATELSAGDLPLCPGAAFFNVSIRLTEDGLSHYHDVIKVVFQYISLIKEHPPEPWIFDEMKNLAEVDFRFRQKSPATRFTSTLSSVMQKPFRREWLLSGPALLRKFDPELITRGLSHLRRDNFNVEVVSQKYPGNWDSKEKWYGTEYKVEKIPEDLLADLRHYLENPASAKIPELHLPHKNEFVPSRLDVEKKEVAEPAKDPSLIRHDDRVRTWFKKDDTFWVPKGTLEATLRTPLVYATPANNVMSRIYCDLVRDALTEYSYDAELAGLDYNLTPSVFGLEVTVAGYNDKMAVLLEKVLLIMRDLEIKPDRFEIVKERMTRGFRNAEYQQPYYQVTNYTRYLTAEKAWINDQLAAELEHIEPHDIATFFPRLLGQTHLETMAHGNLYKEDALKLTDVVESTLKPRALPQSQWHVRRNMLIPPGSNFVYERTLKDPENVNHCIEYYLHLGSLTDDILRAKCLLFGQMTSEPAFDQLRTKEQLGYVVFSGARYASTTFGYRVIVQSDRTAKYLESRIDSFLSCFSKELEDMTDEDFEGHKRSIINKRLEKLKNLSSEANRFWSHIGSEYFDFRQHETDAESLRTLTKPEMMDFYKQYIDPRSPSRAKLSIHLNAQADGQQPQIDPSELRGEVVQQLEGFLAADGVNVDGEKFQQAFENVVFDGDSREAIVSHFRNFLASEMNLAADKVDDAAGKAGQLLETLFMGLGIRPSGHDDQADSVTVNGTNDATPPVEPTYITSVPEWKARLGVSAAPAPVVDLSEFEDSEPKL